MGGRWIRDWIYTFNKLFYLGQLSLLCLDCQVLQISSNCVKIRLHIQNKIPKLPSKAKPNYCTFLMGSCINYLIIWKCTLICCQLYDSSNSFGSIFLQKLLYRTSNMRFFWSISISIIIQNKLVRAKCVRQRSKISCGLFSLHFFEI